MDTIRSDDEAFLAAFLRQVYDDRLAGGGSTLADYERRFPGREDLIRRAWAEVEQPGTETEPDALDASSASKNFTERELGPYRLVEVLGTGGQGEVYLAIDSRTRRKVAIKILHALAATSEELRARFRREAYVASKLDHPGICTLYDTGVVGNIPYLVMRHIEGESLARILERTHSRPSTSQRTSKSSATERTQLLRVLEDVARAVHAAHEAGVLHRDLKPANIMVTPKGEPVVLDFGLARLVEEESSFKTQTGDVFGTPSYLAPETLDTPPARPARSVDIYALGICLYETLTGQRPFAAPTREALYRAVLSSTIVDCRTVDRTISRDLAVIVRTAMARDPHHRYGSALDLAEDLGRLRSERPILARPPRSFIRMLRWIRREKIKAGLFGLGLIVAVLAGYLIASIPKIQAGEHSRRKAALEQVLEEAYILESQGNPRAIQTFDQALQIDPNSEDAVVGRTLALLRLGRPEQALTELKEAPFLPWSATTWKTLRAMSLRDLGRTSEAEAIEATRTERATILDWFAAARREIDLGYEGDSAAFHRAVVHLRRCIFESPTPRARHLFALADALTRSEDAREAANIAEALLTRFPDSARAVAHAGQALTLSDPTRAITLLRRALQLSPNQPGILSWIGEAELARDRPDLAIQAFEEALRMDADHLEARSNLSLAWEAQGDLERAITVGNEVALREPKHPSVHTRLGRLYLANRDFEHARSAFERALEIAPKYINARSNLGVVLLQMSEVDLALEAFRQVKKLRSDNPEDQLNLASALVSHGDTTEALPILENLLTLRPNLFEAQLLLGRAQRDLGFLEEALRSFRRAVRLRPDSAGAQADLADALINSGAWSEAEPALQATMQLAGADPKVPAAIQSEFQRIKRLRDAEQFVQRMMLGEIVRAEGQEEAVAAVAMMSGAHALAARFFCETFKVQPELETQLLNGLRFSAARAAIQATSGVGVPSVKFATEERAAWRLQALTWLEAEVKAWSRSVGAGADRASRLRRYLHRLLADPALVPVREPELRKNAQPPELERWTAFWSSVTLLLDELRG